MHKITALDTIRYRIMDSFPIEGFKVEAGKSFKITDAALKSLKVKRGRIKVEKCE